MYKENQCLTPKMIVKSCICVSEWTVDVMRSRASLQFRKYLSFYKQLRKHVKNPHYGSLKTVTTHNQ